MRMLSFALLILLGAFPVMAQSDKTVEVLSASVLRIKGLTRGDNRFFI